MSSSWFWNHHGKAEGPVSLERMESLIREGLLLQHNLVFKEGGLKWEAASQYIELKEYFRQRDELVSQPAATPATSGKVVHWVVLQKEIREDGVFFRQKGPFAVSEVQEMLRAGVVSPGDFGWTQGFQSWVRLAEVDEFAHGNYKISKESAENLSAVEQFAPALDVLPPPLMQPTVPSPVKATPPQSAPKIPAALAIEDRDASLIDEVTQVPLPEEVLEATVVSDRTEIFSQPPEVPSAAPAPKFIVTPVAAPLVPPPPKRTVAQPPIQTVAPPKFEAEDESVLDSQPVMPVPIQPAPAKSKAAPASAVQQTEHAPFPLAIKKKTPYVRYALAATLPLALYFYGGEVVRLAQKTINGPSAPEVHNPDMALEEMARSPKLKIVQRAPEPSAQTVQNEMPSAEVVAGDSTQSLEVKPESSASQSGKIPLTLPTKTPGLSLRYSASAGVLSVSKNFKPNSSYNVILMGSTGQVLSVPSLYTRFSQTANANGELEISLKENKIPEGNYHLRISDSAATIDEKVSLTEDAKQLKNQLARHRKMTAYRHQQERKRVLSSINRVQSLLSEGARAKSKTDFTALKKKVSALKFAELAQIQSSRYELFFPDAWKAVAEAHRNLEAIANDSKGRNPASVKKVTIEKSKQLKNLEAKVKSFSQYR